MPLTKSSKETVQARAERDPAFRSELFREAVELLLIGDVKTGKAALRDYININATIGFDGLGERTGKSPKNLMRMLSPSGNPQTGNLLVIIHELQRYEGIRWQVVEKNQQPL